MNQTRIGSLIEACVNTAISIARQYVLRRWFNARLHAAAQRLGSRLA